MTGEQSFLFCFHLNKSFFNNVGLKKHLTPFVLVEIQMDWLFPNVLDYFHLHNEHKLIQSNVKH